MAAARLDVSGWQLVYATAGHAPALLISSSGQVRRLGSLGIVLGRLAEAVPGKTVDKINPSAGDRLMLYADGLIEVWNDDGQILGVAALEKIVRKAARLPVAAMREAIVEDISPYSAGPLRDDVTLILAENR